jgi:hypothetical protein
MKEAAKVPLPPTTLAPELTPSPITEVAIEEAIEEAQETRP